MVASSILLRKISLAFVVLLLIFAIHEVSGNIWVVSQLDTLKISGYHPSNGKSLPIEEFLLKLQRKSPKNSEIWSISGNYYLNRMTTASTNKERLAWVDKAHRAYWMVLTCNPVKSLALPLLRRTLRWKNILSQESSRDNLENNT